MDIRIGTVLDGFELLQLLGKGGMGEVYRARDIDLNRIVALKVLNQSLLDRPSIVKRFKVEMQVLAKMQHPNIVKVFTFGDVENVHYFVQEYVTGHNVEELVDAEGPFSEDEAMRLARSLAEAFEHYHPLGVIHRDLKPANIMRNEKNVYKIMDFGLVRDDEETRLTDTGGIVGTLAYIPPDILSGGEPSCQLDVYQLGCILYEVLTGSMIMNDRGFLRVGFKKLRQRLKDLPDLPTLKDKKLERLVRLCLHPDPDIRLHSGSDVLSVLDGKSFPSRIEQQQPSFPDIQKQKTVVILFSFLAAILLIFSVWPKEASNSGPGRQSSKIKLRSPIEFTRSSVTTGRTLTMKFGLNSPASVDVSLRGLTKENLHEPARREHVIDLRIQQHVNDCQGMSCIITAEEDKLFAGELPLGPKVLFSGFRSETFKLLDGQFQNDSYCRLNDHAFPQRMTCGPLIHDDSVYLGDRNGLVYCINIAANETPLKWAYRLPFLEGIRNPRPRAMITKRNEYLIVVADDGMTIHAFCLNSKVRKNEWSERIKSKKSSLDLVEDPSWVRLSESDGEWTRSLVSGKLANRYAAPYVVTPMERVLVVDMWAKTLQLLDPMKQGFVWSHKLGRKAAETGAPVVGKDWAYIIVRGNDGFDELQAFELKNGEKTYEVRLWAGLRELRPTTPLITDDGVIYALSGNYLFRLVKTRPLDLKMALLDGTEWKHRFSGFPTGQPTIADNRLSFFLAEGGRIALLGRQGVHLSMNICSVKVDSKGLRGMRKLSLAEYEIPNLVERDVLVPMNYGDYLILPYGEHLYTIDAKGMKLLFKDPIMGQATNCPIATVNSLLFSTVGGHLYRMGLPSLNKNGLAPLEPVRLPLCAPK